MGEWKKTQCNMCATSCGLEMYVENGHIQDVRPDPDSPRTREYCCRKGRAAKFYVENPDRLDYPMKRVGDHFERISWDQAYKEIAEKANRILRGHGPRAFALVGGTLAPDQADGALAKSFVSGAIGSQYWYCPIGLEFMGSWWSHGRVLGDQVYFTEPDEKNCEMLVLWGANSYVSHQMVNARRVVRRFSQDPDKLLAVIDPRLFESARMADIHIHPRNGSDALFIRGLITLILKNGWQHQAYLDKYAGDWDSAKEWFTGFDERAAFQVCGVPYEEAERFARLLTTKRWGMHQDLGVFCSRHNTLTCFLLMDLMAVCGVLLMPGGCIVQDVFAGRGTSTDEYDSNTWRTVETNKFPVLGVYPVSVIPQEIQSKKTEHIRAMFVTESNPVRAFPNTKAMEEAFKELELLVVSDVCETETTRLAHYVLPAKTGYEAYAFTTFQGGYPDVQCWLKHPVITEQFGERKEGGMIWVELADAMGLLPKLPDSLYQAAKKAVETQDRVPYFLQLLPLIIKDKRNMDILPLIVGKTLGKEMGSAVRALMWAALMSAPIVGTGIVERAGIRPSGKHPVWERMPKLKDLCLMDTVFQMVDDTPQGVVIGMTDPAQAMETHIFHKDKKLHLFAPEIDRYIQRVTPEQEERELRLAEDYPMLLSSGRHMDSGVNGVMRNPGTYRHRRLFTMIINPEDAEALNIADGETVRLVTKTGEVHVPAEYSYGAGRGYVMIPHHFGFTVNGETNGSAANTLTASENIDELTGNPLLRYIPCRIEKLPA